MKTSEYDDDRPKPISSMSLLSSEALSRVVVEHKPMPRGIHSELHEMVAILRKEFGETAKKGKGSFGFYLRLLKPVPMAVLHRWLANIKDSPNLDTPLAKAKIFWWSYKKWKTGIR